MCTHCSGVRRSGIIETVSQRTPPVFPGPEKRDGEVLPDIISARPDPFPPPVESSEGESLLDQATLPDLFSEL